MKNKSKQIDVCIIKDWAGNVYNFNGKFLPPETSVPMKFYTPEDAMDYLCEHFGSDEIDDLYIESEVLK